MNFELDFIHWLQDARTELLDAFFKFFTLFGEELILIGVLGFVYWCYNKKIGEKIGLTVFISLGLNSILKLIIARPRPFMKDPTIENLKPSTSGNYSFPSGHTQTAATLFFSLYTFIKKRWLLIVAIVITTLVALSRMYLGVHYLTDVLVGALLGIGLSIFFERYLTSETKIKTIYQILFGLIQLAFVAIVIINYVRNKDAGVLDASAMYFDTESIAKMFGTISGFILAIQYEKKVVHFENHNILWKNIIRVVLGFGIIFALRIVLKGIFTQMVDPETLTNSGFLTIVALCFDYVRYLIMLLIGIGVYPKLFKALHI